MGLLDDAIREHLELKRLRGADPGEVARAEREALDPVPRDGEPARDSDSGPMGDVAPEAIDDAGHVGETRAEDRSAETHESAQPMAYSDDPQETAELDMRSLLSEKQGVIAEEQPEGDRLEWEVPGEPVGSPPVSTEGDEHGSAGKGSAITAAEAHGAGQSSDDALSAAYGSSGDAPEQRHLWSEQRAPSDSELDR
jgi:hypothetical protein